MLQKGLIIALFLTSLTHLTYGQSTMVSSLVASFEVIQDSTTQTISLAALMAGGNTTTVSSNDSMQLKVRMNLQTIQDVDKIHVKVGTTSGGTDLAQHIFLLDNVTNLPIGYDYIRDEGTLKLTMGKHLNPPTIYYVEVIIEDINGNMTSSFSYQSN